MGCQAGCWDRELYRKEKGQASDSFKRACFNWGIGRELYTAPFIWIGRADCSIQEAVDSRGQKRYTCYDSFHVAQIGYDENRNINALVIKRIKAARLFIPWGRSRRRRRNHLCLPLLIRAA